MRLAPTLAVAILLARCVTQAQIDRARAFQASIPTCSSDRECELKWSAARQWILSKATMKLQHVTPDFMETYNPPPKSLGLAARVTKEPIATGGYRLVVTTWCGGLGCAFPSPRHPWEAAQDFNDTVNAAAPSATPTSPTPPAVAAPSETPLGPQRPSTDCPSGELWNEVQEKCMAGRELHRTRSEYRRWKATLQSSHID